MITDKQKPRKRINNDSVAAAVFVAPLVIGLLMFTVWPMIDSIYLSLCKYDVFSPAKYIGGKNYVKLFHDPLFWQALKVTTIYACVSVPMGLIAGMALALLLNTKIKGMGLFRTIYYLPAVLSGVAVSLLWAWVFNPDFGMANYVLAKLHLAPLPWLTSPDTALTSLIIMSLWGVGGAMVINLAGLQGISPELYESASLDGASPWKQLLHITIPGLTPVIFYNLVMGIIGSFQVFTQAFVMTSGGPSNSTLFYVLYLFKHAFNYFNMGYASAMAWVLFIIILALTLLVFKSSSLWVYYEGGSNENK